MFHMLRGAWLVLIAAVASPAQAPAPQPTKERAQDRAQEPVFDFPDLTGHAEEFAGVETKIKVARYVVIGDAKAWARLWREHDPDRAVPVIDFDNALMVCVFRPEDTSGFRIDCIVRGAFSSDSYSYNVFLKADDRKFRYAMVRVDRTRRDFRFYAQGDMPTVAKAELVARRDVESDREPDPALRVRLLELLDRDRSAQTSAALLALGDPARPLLHEVIAATDSRLYAARAVLHAMDRQEIEAAGRPIRFSEIAFAKACAEVRRRAEFDGSPWYVDSQVRQRDGLWYVATYGTFAVSSEADVCSQPGMQVRMVLRAADGAVVRCDIQRDDRPLHGAFGRNAPGVVPVEEGKE
jgi:hypothetical protein